VVWTDPYWDTAGLGWMMTCSMPLYDEKGEFFGVQCVDVTLDSIIENAVSVKLDETGYVFLINEKGNVIALPERARKDLNLEYKEVITPEEQVEVTNTTVLTFSLLDHPNKEFSTLIKKVIDGENVTETVKFDEKKYLTLFPIEITGWAVGVVVPVKETLAPIRNAVIVAIVLAVGICLAISAILSRRIAK
jgi:Cache domain.